MLDLIDILDMTIPFDTNPYKCLYYVISLSSLRTCVLWVNSYLRYEVLTSIRLSGHNEYWKILMTISSQLRVWSYHFSFGLLSFVFFWHSYALVLKLGFTIFCIKHQASRNSEIAYLWAKSTLCFLPLSRIQMLVDRMFA